MTTDKSQIQKIFEEYKTIAVYGMSKSPEKPSHFVPAYLSAKGYNIIPINPGADRIIGQKSHPDLSDVEKTIDILQVFRPSDKVIDVVKKAVIRKKQKGDIAVIWLQEGIQNEEARKLALEEDIIFIQDKCMLKEYKRTFPERA